MTTDAGPDIPDPIEGLVIQLALGEITYRSALRMLSDWALSQESNAATRDLTERINNALDAFQEALTLPAPAAEEPRTSRVRTLPSEEDHPSPTRVSRVRTLSSEEPGRTTTAEPPLRSFLRRFTERR